MGSPHPRVPPLIILLLVGGLMLLLARTVPVRSYELPWRKPAVGLIAFIGGVIVVSGVVSFRRARTTVNPRQPQLASALVTSGVYRLTRNPMYLGMLLWLIAWTGWLAHPLALLGPALFVVGINRFQIKPEEAALERLFGEAFLAYRRKVRRWI